MPLTTTWTASRVSKCGCAFSSLTRPCVAQRVWAMPVVRLAGGGGHAAGVALGERGVEVVEVADRADRVDLVAGEHADARGVIAAVLELAQALDQEVLDRPVADVADDAAHERERGYPPLSTTPTRRLHTASASSSVGASTMTRTSCSVPLGRTRTRPRPSSASLSRSVGVLQRLGRHRRVAVGHADVDEPLRQLLHRRAVGEVAALQRLERQERRGDPVAGGDEAHVDQVAGLLAAELPPRAPERLEDVAVADLRRSRPPRPPRAWPGGSRSSS